MSKSKSESKSEKYYGFYIEGPDDNPFLPFWIVDKDKDIKKTEESFIDDFDYKAELLLEVECSEVSDGKEFNPDILTAYPKIGDVIVINNGVAEDKIKEVVGIKRLKDHPVFDGENEVLFEIRALKKAVKELRKDIVKNQSCSITHIPPDLKEIKEELKNIKHDISGEGLANAVNKRQTPGKLG